MENLLLINNLSILLEKCGYKHKIISQKIGYTPEYLSNIKSGKYNASLNFLRAISKFFADTISELKNYDFRDGQALLNDNFSEILNKKNDLIPEKNNNILSRNDLRNNELDFIMRLRQLKNKSDIVPLNQTYLDKVLRCLSLASDKVIDSLSDVIEELRRAE